MREEPYVFSLLNILTHSGNIGDQIKSCIKSPQILHVFGPNFLGEGLKLYDLHNKVRPDSDRVALAKFHCDRLRELEHLVANK